MSTWIDTYPTRVKKQDLRNHELRASVDYQPEPMQKYPGMFTLVVVDWNDSRKTFNVAFITETDLDGILRAYRNKKPFIFDDSKPYPNVKEIEPKLGQPQTKYMGA